MAASTLRQSLINRKPNGFCSHFCGIITFQPFFKHCNCFSPEVWLKILIATLIDIKIFSHFPNMLEFDPIFLESLVLRIFLYSILFHIYYLWGINFYKILFLHEWQAFCKHTFWVKKISVSCKHHGCAKIDHLTLYECLIPSWISLKQKVSQVCRYNFLKFRKYSAVWRWRGARSEGEFLGFLSAWCVICLPRASH